MTAAVEVERCSPTVTAVQMHFADIDLKKAPLQPTPPSASIRIESNPVPPPADELAERLAELEKRPLTPTAKDQRPVPTPLTDNNKKTCELQQSHQDSGYASIASSPEGLEPEKSQEAGFSSSKLRVFDRPIPEYLQHRFYDLKVLHSQDLLKAVYKKNVDQKDLSMKLKYLGKSEPSAQLYIVVQCEAKYAKKVKKFFAQTIVQEYLGDDFKLHIINRAPRGLASAEEIQVYGFGITATMCGQPVMLSNGETSAFATMGGTIQVLKTLESTPTLYGFTAAHSLISLMKLDAAGEIDSFEDDASDSSDGEDDFVEDDEVLFDELSDDELETDPHPFSSQNTGVLGSIVASSIRMPVNRDWSLISIDQTIRLPNLTHNHDSSKNSELQPIYFSSASLSFSHCTPVTVATCRGPRKGTLETNKSFLFSTPGTEMMSTFDLKLDRDNSLKPGDSGSWVVDTTGRLLGHVASIDAFGEAFVVPMSETLGDIREELNAAVVTLPSQDDLNWLHSTTISGPLNAKGGLPSTINTETETDRLKGNQDDSGEGGRRTTELSGQTLLNDDGPAVLQLSDLTDQAVATPPDMEDTMSNIPVPKAKKTSKSRFSNLARIAKNLMPGRKPVTEVPVVKPSLDYAAQFPAAPMYYYPQAYMAQAGMNQQSGMPTLYPPVPGEGLYKSDYGPPPILAYAYQQQQQQQQQSPPPQQGTSYGIPSHNKSGYDSGYASLQPSAQCSPAPSPPSPTSQ
jgi:hypothetical protein